MKKICTSLLSLMVLTSTTTNLNYASAVEKNVGNLNVNVNVNLENSNKEISSQNKTAYVSSFEDLKIALKNDKIETIVLEKNIDALGSLKIDRSVVLDLNGYKLQFLTKNSLIIGGVSANNIKKTKYSPGHWEKNPTRYKVIEKGHYEEKKFPGHFECGAYGSNRIRNHTRRGHRKIFVWILAKFP